ncbi:MAG: hypothetical protein C0469_07885 [Cyanobacteria bacterium DS2.3.42]|nr:hypothetical protein [Cyanobacteria bacterium DS2.3.42]
MTQSGLSAKLVDTDDDEHIKMKYYTRIQTTICVVMLAICSLFPRAGWCAKKVTYLHVQQAHNVLGPVDLLASTGTSVLVLKKLDCSIYFDAKNQSVLVVSPVKKLYFQTPLNKFEYGLANTLDTITDLELSAKFWKFKGKSTLCGNTVDDYIYNSTVSAYENGNAFLPGKRGETSVYCKFSTLQSPLATKSLCQLLRKMEHVPNADGVPVRMEASYAHGRLRKTLTTLKINVEQLPEKFPPPLSGFTKAKKSSDIFFGSLNLIDAIMDK